jgi:hypothetical protein
MVAQSPIKIQARYELRDFRSGGISMLSGVHIVLVCRSKYIFIIKHIPGAKN